MSNEVEQMMLKVQWISAVAMCTYTLLFAVSVVVLYRQLRELRREVRNSTIGKYWAQWVEMDKWFANNPDLKPFFYRGKDFDCDADNTINHLRDRVDSTAEMLLDSFANLYYRAEGIGNDKEWSIFREFIRRLYRTQPCFTRFVDDHIHWYSDGFSNFIRERPITRP